VAKLRPRPPQEELVADPTICELQDRLRAAATSTSDVSPWCMSLLVWSYATLGMNDAALFGRIAELAAPRMMEFKPVELTNVVWALAKGGTVSPLFFEAAAVAVARRASELSASCVCNLLWSLGTALPHLHAPDVPVVASALAQRVTLTAHEAQPKDIARAAWGLGQLEPRAASHTRFGPSGQLCAVSVEGKAFAALAKASRFRLEYFKVTDLHALVCALDRAGVLRCDAGLATTLTHAVATHLTSLDVSQMAQLAGSNFASPQLLAALAELLQSRLAVRCPKIACSLLTSEFFA